MIRRVVMDKEGKHISTLYHKEPVQELPVPADDF